MIRTIGTLMASRPATLPTYATWNPLDKAAAITLSADLLTATADNTTTENCRSTIGKSTGKWYWEYTINAAVVNSTSHGVETSAELLSVLCGATTAGYGYNDVGQKKTNNVDSSYGTACVNGDILSVLLNMDAGEISMRRNNTDFGVMFTGLSGTFFAAFSSGFGANSIRANFGASAFTNTVPSGYNAGLYN